MKYKRIVLKLSGEGLKDLEGMGIGSKPLGHYCEEIMEAYRCGIGVAVVIGGGNFWRGDKGEVGGDIARSVSDGIGMLATMMNALALREGLAARGAPTIVMSHMPIPKYFDLYNAQVAIKALEERKIVVIGGGLGLPFFSTDTAAIHSALSLGAEVMLKGTKVAGVYAKDPLKHPESKPYVTLSQKEAVERGLRVMDMTALTLAQEHSLPIIVYDAQKRGNLGRIIQGAQVGTRLY